MSPETPLGPTRVTLPEPNTDADPTRAGTEPAPPHTPVLGRAADSPALIAAPGYEVTRLIARGGMGAVYAARDLALDRDVAIKTLLPGAGPARFVTEAKITGRLAHPGIPPVHALGTLPDGGPFLVMKLVHGHTLAQLLNDRHTPAADLPRFVQVFEQVAQAVGFAHSRGVIHRDLKPLNVMVGEFGEVQVMDWGLAKDAAADRAAPAGAADPGAAEPTRAGAIMGTPGYMAPEQARGEVVDARADVFALGSVLATILTGAPAFVGATARETVAKAAAADLADVLARLGACGADAELVALARRCLAASAAARPADARAVSAEVGAYRAGVEARLRQAEADRAKAETQAAEQRKRRRVMQWAAGAVAAVLLLGIAGTAVGLVQAERAREREKDRADGEEREKDEKGRALARAEEAARTEKAAIDKLWDGLDAMTSNTAGDALTSQAAVSDQQKRFFASVLPLFRTFADRKTGDHAMRARAIRAALRVGMMEWQLGRHGTAVERFRSAQADFTSLVEQFPDVAEYRASLARSYTNLALFLVFGGDRDTAMAQYQTGLERWTELVARYPDEESYREELATLCDRYAYLKGMSNKPNDRAEGVELLHRVLGQWEALSAAHPAKSKYHIEVSRAHVRLSTLLGVAGRPADAEQHRRAARELMERLAARHPDVPEYRAHWAYDIQYQALHLANTGRPKEAEGEYRKAHEILASLSQAYPTITGYSERLAESHGRIAWALERQGKWPEAASEQGRAVQVRRRLADSFPGKFEYRVQLAEAHDHMVYLLENSNSWVQADQQAANAFTLWENLAAEYPDVQRYAFNLAKSYERRAGFSRLTRTAESLEMYGQAIKILDRIHAASPSEVTRLSLGSCCKGRAEAYRLTGAFDKAVADWDRVVELSAPQFRDVQRAYRASCLVEAGRPDQALAEVEELSRSKTDLSGFSLTFARVYARVHATAGRADSMAAERAIEFLNKAVQKGHVQNANTLRTDKAFDAVRERDDFKKLLDAVERRNAPKREGLPVAPPPRART